MNQNEQNEAKKLLSFKKSTNEEDFNSSPFLVHHTVYDSINSVNNPSYSQPTSSDNWNSSSFFENGHNSSYSNFIGSTASSISDLGNSVKKGKFKIQLLLCFYIIPMQIKKKTARFLRQISKF